MMPLRDLSTCACEDLTVNRASGPILACALIALLGTSATAQQKPDIIPANKVTDLAKFAVEEKATVFAFYNPSSSLESQFVSQLAKEASPHVSVRLIAIKTGSEPVAKLNKIVQTPAAIVMDRRHRVTGRSADIDEIRGFVRKAERVMRIDWAMEGTELFDAAAAAAGGKGLKPGIMRTMSLQPEWLKHFYEMTRMAHFTDTGLTRRSKEMIATYVSAINHCKF
jgi:hypothetical protein